MLGNASKPPAAVKSKYNAFISNSTASKCIIYRELQQHLQNDFPEPLVSFAIGGYESSHPAVAGGVQCEVPSTWIARRFIATPFPTEFP